MMTWWRASTARSDLSVPSERATPAAAAETRDGMPGIGMELSRIVVSYRGMSCRALSETTEPVTSGSKGTTLSFLALLLREHFVLLASWALWSIIGYRFKISFSC